MRNFHIFILFQCLSIGQIIAQTPSALTKGLTAPDFVAKDTLGVEHRLSDFAGKVIGSVITAKELRTLLQTL